ncbi:MAG: hypothetical protein HY046_04770 [Acidobacteria bacterium]|nr:hypothetical protein [Acidobacteriota bacterium]
MLATKKIKGTVEHSLLGRPGVEGMMLQFHVVGPTLKISAIQFGHALAAEDKRIGTLSRELIGKPYSQFVAQLFAVEQIRPIYFEKGFLRAQFPAPQARFTGDPNKPLPDEVTLIFPIEPGPTYKWYGANWTGNTVYSTAALDVMTALVTNELADGMKIAAQWDHIRAEYGRKGFLDTTLETAPVFDEPTGRVTYNVTIHEGAQYKMGELVLTGLSVAAERKLKEAWRLQRGELFDRVYFDEFYASGIKKLFEDTPVHFSEIGQWLRANPETKIVDVLLDFK